MGGNQLRDIPATIGKLKNLSSLVLSGNNLETIPSTVANLHRLQSLSLHNNCLRVSLSDFVLKMSFQFNSVLDFTDGNSDSTTVARAEHSVKPLGGQVRT